MKKSIENAPDPGPVNVGKEAARKQRPASAVTIGVSAGGMEALSEVLPAFPENYGLAVVIVQHVHPQSNGYFVRYFEERCRLPVKTADEKEAIEPGRVYIAPPNYHLLVEADRTFSLSVDPAVNYARPSIDVFFETAAEAFGPELCGVILTGANTDGSNGLRAVREKGGITVVQDPDTAEVPAMPRAALKATEVDHVLPLERIGPFLSSLKASR